MIIRILFLLTIVPSLISSQGLMSKTYGIIGYRNYSLSEDINFITLDSHLDMWDSYITDYNPRGSTWIFGMGYKGYNQTNPNYTKFTNFYLNFEFDALEYDAYESWGWDYSDYFPVSHWVLGGGYGFITKDGLSVDASVEYNFFTDVDQYADYELDEFVVPSGNYISLNLSFGFSKRSSWGPWGLYYSKPINKRFINSQYPTITGNQFLFEMPLVVAGGAILLVGAAAAMADGADLPSYGSDSGSSSLGRKGCHVYGKIKFVEFGEDYKVKFVSFGEDLKVKYVDFGADSPGEWKVVDFGEDYKIKVVQFGEDIKVKEVSFGQGCN